MKTKSGRDFPKDFIRWKKKNEKTYRVKRNRQLFPFAFTEQGKRTVQLQHHPVFLLVEEELMNYDLNDRKERSQFLALCTTASLIDDYGLVSGKMKFINATVHEINATTDLNEFIDELVEAEEKIKEITHTLDIEEVQESRALEGRDQTDVIKFITKDVE